MVTSPSTLLLLVLGVATYSNDIVRQSEYEGSIQNHKYDKKEGEGVSLKETETSVRKASMAKTIYFPGQDNVIDRKGPGNRYKTEFALEKKLSTNPLTKPWKKASLTNQLKSTQEKPVKGPGNRYEADFSLVDKLSSHVSTKPFTTAWAQTLNINFAKLQEKFGILPGSVTM